VICPKCKSIRLVVSDWYKDQTAHALCRDCGHPFTVRVDRDSTLPPAPPPTSNKEPA
jgi:Zn ribbon nucleic-acid-binding protein